MTSTKSKVAGAVGLAATAGAALFALQQPASPKCSDGDVVCFSWAPSPGWDDNTPYAPGTVVEYTIYRFDAARNTSMPIINTRDTSVMILDEPRGKQCYFFTAKVGSVQSVVVPKHPGKCLMVRPKAPSDGAIEAPTDGAIEPR